MSTATSLKLNRRVIQWSVLMYIAFVLPFSLLHETGHALVCSANGSTYLMWLDGTGGHLVCARTPDNSVAYGAMGGIFGLLGSAAIIAFWALAKRRYPALLVVGLAYAIDQSAKLILEGLFTPLYTSGTADLSLTALQLVSWIGLTIFFAKVPRAAAVASRTTA